METEHNDNSLSTIHNLRLIRVALLCETIGVSSWTLRRWIAAGEFPRPFRATAESPDMWRLRDIEAWIALKKRQRQRKPLRGATKSKFERRMGGDDFEPTIEQLLAAIAEANASHPIAA
jgi:predicted DNA-binding transcriptional regulator AlpA